MMQAWLPTIGARTLLDNSEFWPLDRIVPLFPTRRTKCQYDHHTFIGLGTFVRYGPGQTYHDHLPELFMLPFGSATARRVCYLLRMLQCCSRSIRPHSRPRFKPGSSGSNYCRPTRWRVPWWLAFEWQPARGQTPEKIFKEADNQALRLLRRRDNPHKECQVLYSHLPSCWIIDISMAITISEFFVLLAGSQPTEGIATVSAPVQSPLPGILPLFNMYHLYYKYGNEVPRRIVI